MSRRKLREPPAEARKRLVHWIEDQGVLSEEEGVILADGLESGFVGLASRFNKTVAVYDRDLCIRALVENHGMTWEGAVEYFCFNVENAFVGDDGPVFLFSKRQATRAT